MKSKLVVLDFQHINKPNRPKDRGASYPGHIDSKIKAFNEVDIVIEYMNKMRIGLEKSGHKVVFGLSGFYGQRHTQVNDMFPGANLYIAGHINAGGGSYARVEVDYRAGSSTRRIAGLVSDNFAKKLPVSRSEVTTLRKTSRGFSCINGVRCSAILLEPLFIDYKSHREFMSKQSGTKAIADSVIEAVNVWAQD